MPTQPAINDPMTPTQTPAVATHTPTPWRANESAFSANGMTELHIGTPELTACVVYVDKAAPYAATQEANAAYIVKACNSHAQLVAALEDLLRNATDKERYISILEGTDVETSEQADELLDSPEMKRARAALQSAKE